LVSALAYAALAMCAMWVGFLSSFFAGGRKKQNKFPSNLHCPVKKLNPFFRYYLSLSYLSVVCLFTLVANGWQHEALPTLAPLSCPPALTYQR